MSLGDRLVRGLIYLHDKVAVVPLLVRGMPDYFGRKIITRICAGGLPCRGYQKKY
jgi:hypothetical protein